MQAFHFHAEHWSTPVQCAEALLEVVQAPAWCSTGVTAVSEAMTREELAAVGFPYSIHITGLNDAPSSVIEYLSLLTDAILEERARVDRLTSNYIRVLVDNYEGRRSASIIAFDEAAGCFREHGRR
jgi:hypothetical protein